MPPSEANEGKAVVSRYFKYKSSQSLRDDARRLGLDVELENDLTPLRTAPAREWSNGRQPAGDPADGGLRRQP